MIELHGGGDDALFQSRRFQRMLRQAHDANVVELAKVEGVYRLKLVPEAEQKGEGTEKVAAPSGSTAPKADRAADSGDAETGSKPKRTSTRRSTRGRGRSSRKKAEAPAEGDGPKRAQGPAGTAEAPAAESKRRDTSAKSSRNPRYRRGSRGGRSARSPNTGTGDAASGNAVTETTATASPAIKAHRGGERSDTTRQGAATPDTLAPSEEASQPVVEEVPESPQQGSLFDGTSQEDGSLFRRMTAALQRVVRGPESE